MTGYARRFIYPFGWTMAFCDPGLDDRQLHADADAQLALAEDLADADGDERHQAPPVVSRRWIAATPRRCAGRSRIRWRSSASRPPLVALTFPLNRMVGRTFVPNEDMGEFTVHADTPQGTSLEGTTEIARNVVKEIGEQEGVSHVAYLAGADRYTHFHVLFYLLPVDGADGHAGAGDRAGAQGPGAAPGLQRDGAGAESARRRRQRRHSGGPARARHRQALRLLAADSREGARRRRAWSTRGPTTAMPAPRCRSPWIGRARPTSASAWRRSATRCG